MRRPHRQEVALWAALWAVLGLALAGHAGAGFGTSAPKVSANCATAVC